MSQTKRNTPVRRASPRNKKARSEDQEEATSPGATITEIDQRSDAIRQPATGSAEWVKQQDEKLMSEALDTPISQWSPELSTYMNDRHADVVSILSLQQKFSPRLPVSNKTSLGGGEVIATLGPPPLMPYDEADQKVISKEEWDTYLRSLSKYLLDGGRFERKSSLTEAQQTFLTNQMRWARSGTFVAENWLNEELVSSEDWIRAMRHALVNQQQSDELEVLRTAIVNQRRIAKLPYGGTAVKWVSDWQLQRGRCTDVTAVQEADLIKLVKNNVRVWGLTDHSRNSLRDLWETQARAAKPSFNAALSAFADFLSTLNESITSFARTFNARVVWDQDKAETDTNSARTEPKEQTNRDKGKRKAEPNPQPTTTTATAGNTKSQRTKEFTPAEVEVFRKRWGSKFSCAKCGQKHPGGDGKWHSCSFTGPFLNDDPNLMWHESHIGKEYYKLGRYCSSKEPIKGFNISTRLAEADSIVNPTIPAIPKGGK